MVLEAFLAYWCLLRKQFKEPAVDTFEAYTDPYTDPYMTPLILFQEPAVDAFEASLLKILRTEEKTLDEARKFDTERLPILIEVIYGSVYGPYLTPPRALWRPLGRVPSRYLSGGESRSFITASTPFGEQTASVSTV